MEQHGWGDGDGIEIRLSMTDEQAFEFIERLTEDDDFRSRYEKEPRAVLEEYGIHLPEGAVPESASAPPKEALRGAREELGRMRDAGEGEFRFWGWAPAYLALMRFWRFRRFGPGEVGGDEG